MTKEKLIISKLSTPIALFLIVLIGLVSYFTTKIVAVPVELIIAFLFIWLWKNDKVQHVYAGDFIAILVASELYRYTGWYIGPCCIIGATFAAIVGVLKERWYDRALGKGTPSFWDGAATAFGGVLGAIEFRITMGVLNGEGISPIG